MQRDVRQDSMTSGYEPSYPRNRCDSVAFPQWPASTGHVVGVRGIRGSKSGQDIMTSVPPSVLFHSSFSSLSSHIRTPSALGLTYSLYYQWELTSLYEDRSNCCSTVEKVYCLWIFTRLSDHHMVCKLDVSRPPEDQNEIISRSRGVTTGHEGTWRHF